MANQHLVKGVCINCKAPYEYVHTFMTKRKYCDACSIHKHGKKQANKRFEERQREAKKKRGEYIYHTKNNPVAPAVSPGKSRRPVLGRNPKT